MRKLTSKTVDKNGNVMRVSKDMKSLLNYNILRLLNKTRRVGWLELPVIHCHTDVVPDFLALYKEPSLYNKTENTAVCFYCYDNEFDGKNGLFWAIYFNDSKRLEYFKLRFKNVKIFITPDYSVFNDVHKIENLIRLWKARIITLWLSIELGAIVIPNASYICEDEFQLFFDGLEGCETIAFSIKSHTRSRRERRLCEKAIEYVADHFNKLKRIIVYSACGKDETCLRMFKYAINKGIQVFVPKHTLLERNKKLMEAAHVLR